MRSRKPWSLTVTPCLLAAAVMLAPSWHPLEGQEEMTSPAEGGSLAVSLAKAAVAELEDTKSAQETIAALTFLHILIRSEGEGGERLRVGLEDARAVSVLGHLGGRLESGKKKGQIRGTEADLKEALLLTEEAYEELERSLGWDQQQFARPAQVYEESSGVVAFVDLAEDVVFQWWKVEIAQSGLHELRLMGSPGREVLVVDGQDIVKARGQAEEDRPFLFAIEPGTYLVRLKPVAQEAPQPFEEEETEALEEPSVTRAAIVRALALPPSRERSDAPLAEAAKSYRAQLKAGTGQWARFESQQGTLYTAETSGMSSGCDTKLAVYGAGEDPIGSDDDSGAELFASRVKWYAPADGPYWLQVTEVSDAACTLSIRIDGEKVEGTPVVPAADRTEAPALESGGGAVVVASGSGPVFIRVPAQPGRAYLIESPLDLAVETAAGAPAVRVWDREVSGADAADAEIVTSGVWALVEEGGLYLRFEPLGESGIETVRVADAGEFKLPEVLQLPARGAKPKAVPTLPTRLRAAVSIQSGQVLVAKLTLTAGDSVVIGAQPLDRDLAVTVGRLEDGKKKEPEPAAEDLEDLPEDLTPQNEWLFLAKADGEVLVQLTNTSEVPGTFLLEVEVEKPYSGFKVGDRVILGRHRPVQGDSNWAPDMGSYVGKVATINRLVDGTEEFNGVEGVYLVRVDEDEEQYVWRTRDLRPAPPEAEASPAEEPLDPEPEAPPVEPVPR